MTQTTAAAATTALPAPDAAARPRARTSRLQRQEAAYGYAFIAPAMIGFAVFVAGPLLGVFYFSGLDYNSLSGKETWVGLQNFADLFTSPVFADVMGNTTVFALAVVPLNIVLGLLLAVLVNARIRFIGIFRTAFFVPVVISLVAWSLVWDYLLQANGGLNAWLSQIGITGPNWLADPTSAMPTMIAVQVLKGVGVSMILFLAALQEVPEEIKEASRVDGANGVQSFVRITLPLISPTILFVGILATINALKAFAQIYLLTQGGPGLSTTVLGYYIYDQAFNAFQVGSASAGAVVLFVIALVITLAQWMGRRKWVFNES
ncbi:carbohydrate ABC transporter permease [Plantibacter sp. VKM Ac-2885]|uniref:carbohydrate ABC transporter permease n=1 Tax=Plantibacter sp. VKM Ac-2885 TaxID=2783828 RepID=UPI00351C1957